MQNMLENQRICRTWRIFGHIGQFNCLGQGTPEQPLGKRKKKTKKTAMDHSGNC